MLKKFLLIIAVFSIILSNNTNQINEQMLNSEAMHEMMSKIFKEAMKAKKSFQNNQMRNELIENLSSTAPREEFIINADLAPDLSNSNPNAKIHISTDNQQTWTDSENIGPLNEPGFETTWGTIINTSAENSVNWYLSGSINSTALGNEAYDYGEIIVSQSPHNINNIWPPSNNLMAVLVNDDPGDTDQGQDIVGISGTYRATDENINELFFKLSMNSNCCYEGSLFSGWYLYGVGIVNPESTTPVAYAIGYGNGAFGQLSPGLLKLSGDFASGELAGFEYITTDINYLTSGNDLELSILMDYITSDDDFGLWPNSFQGLIVLGTTVSANITFSTTIHDTTNPGLFLLSSQYQNGNSEPNISNGNYNDDTKTLSVSYQDDEGNLPWLKSGQVCYSGTNDCFLNLTLIPDSHTYLDSVLYSGSIANEEIEEGNYDIKFWFEDDDIVGEPQITIPIVIGSSCSIFGDVNGDNLVNVIDVVSIVNYVLNNDNSNNCADLTNDELINVVDIVQLVNIILEN